MRPSRKASLAEGCAEILVDRGQGVHFAALLRRAEPLVAQIGDHLLGLDFGVVERYAVVIPLVA